MNLKEIVLEKIIAQGTLPLFFHHDKAESIEILRTLYQAGIRVFEFTNRGPEALDVFESLVAARNLDMPDLYLGIGTIKSVDEAQQFLQIGADFIVSPIVNPLVGSLVHEQHKLWIPGCMTPTEIYTAQQQEAALIKLFPANILGPAFMSSIRELFKGQKFMPTGGVEIEMENLKAWFKSGVCAVGMGSKLIDPKDTSNLFENTKKALEFVSKAR
ncbi:MULTISPECIES: bifunctional 4-hydroxy-2-oxoglutarate aldolase/2-dehydro-3-deoxy-phosphogluconate aldolase [Sphingobacterium]|uniref:bifunctional 4-hydroxy-2-oxoglutarate aldolase/2-dehydro-3-deoxy-phosphogluconate aldolase n=1 Tax=Sphingobacterium TaxID=28453 RepID=UPI0009586BD2|nr:MULTISPECIES: bifunctional 4-hydroxy-2-oxoglutarate aldolase/2-dehydro-3-deoxy-phosphogluconate aldolase [Sphingobacterium]APU94954.1 bifunctional 4-hydroxy-2-oxoglutarate aldolase/2-dehydro-3-deoxy-phosphogluconate aldolase [Sphingobacterium sp. B29]UQA75266.1 bifunctional 4-hydroxy-2-oxoglutarate aldolase/2-dehydro-3-deoxy-phosphogluconate aldolase [Sphingobacterium siyangense]